MKMEDIQVVSNLGQSLWARPEQSRAITRETISAVTLLDSNPDRAIEKACEALLDRANQKGMYARVPSGFHALFPEERFVLLALHRGHWSYERISRVIHEPLEAVRQLAWNARVYLALSRYPVAPAGASPSCPEYDPQKPWTQSFLDDELSGQDRLFLQNHTTHCQSCRDALLRAKDVYYRVQQQIESLESKLPEPGLTAQLDSVIRQGERFRYPSTATPTEALARFFARTEVRLILLGWVVALVWMIKR